MHILYDMLYDDTLIEFYVPYLFLHELFYLCNSPSLKEVLLIIYEDYIYLLFEHLLLHILYHLLSCIHDHILVLLMLGKKHFHQELLYYFYLRKLRFPYLWKFLLFYHQIHSYDDLYKIILQFLSNDLFHIIFALLI